MDRLRAALRALRQTDNGQNELQLGDKCLAVVIDHLQQEGLSPDELAPLAAVHAALQRPATAPQTPDERRRHGRGPSEALLARVSAVIDLLVKAGYDESEAAQAIMRRLIAVGVAPPRSGGDARGWKRLLAWRSHLLHGNASEEARDAYDSFVQQIEAIPPQERVRAVFSEQLWDRRRKPRSV
jgi:hypothetical protein